MFQYFPRQGFGDLEVQSFSVFPRWHLYHVTYYVIIIINYYRRRYAYGQNFVSIGPGCKENIFQNLSNQALCLSNDDVIMKKMMTSSLTHPIPHGEYLTVSHVSIFSMAWFRRYRGAKFFQDGAYTT